MTVKIDELEPNIFPAIEHLDARDAGRNVEVILETRIEGKQVLRHNKTQLPTSSCFGGAPRKDRAVTSAPLSNAPPPPCALDGRGQRLRSALHTGKHCA
jgi:hypothetical protein